ncbi:hypothetical protein ABKV19_018334 [Rosa sericea]
MVDSPELRWAFIRKVYVILTVQLLLTIAVAATVDLVLPIAYFLVKTRSGLAVDITGRLRHCPRLLMNWKTEKIFHPLGKISHMMYGIVGCIIFCGYIVYDTDKLIKRHHYDDYMLAAIELYLDAINLFSSMIVASDS